MKSKLKKIIAKGLLVLELFTVIFSSVINVKASEPSFLHFICGDCLEVDYQITSEWDNHYNVLINLKNTSDEVIHNWSVYFDCKDNIYDLYNADLADDGTFCSKDYNQDINPGEVITLGFTAEYSGEIHNPTSCLYCTEYVEVEDGKYSIDYISEDNQLSFCNISDERIEDWVIEINTNRIIEYSDEAIITKTDSGYLLSPVNYHQNLSAGESYTINLHFKEPDDIDISSLEVSSLKSYKSASVSHSNIHNSENTEEISANEVSENEVSNNEVVSENVVSNNTVSINDVIYVNLEGYSYNSDIDMYNIDTNVSSISGNVLTNQTVKSITISVNNIDDEEIWRGELLDPSSSWSIEEFGLVTGFNYINIEVNLEDNSKLFETIIVTNMCRDNIYNTYIDLGDNDNDGITNYEEKILGLDINSTDTDGDLLSDLDEIARSYSNPLVYDSNIIDSDMDGIVDYDELVVYGTNPFLDDSDNDDVMDGTELKLGLNPLVNDSDQTVETVIYKSISNNALVGAELDITCNAKKIDEIYIFDLPNITADGIIGVPVEFHADKEFDNVEIAFSYDIDKLPCSEENLGIAWLNYNTMQFELLSGTEINTNEKKIKYKSSHLSTYVLVDLASFAAVAGEPMLVDESWDFSHGKIVYNKDNNHSYMIIDNIGDWYQAWEKCEEIGGHLLTINDSDEQQFINDNVLIMKNDTGDEELRSKRYFIGAYSQGYPYEFEWVTEEPFEYKNWDTGEPNLKNEYYVEIYGEKDSKLGKWNNIINDVTMKKSCICEFEGGVPAKINSSSSFIEVDSIDYIPGCNVIYNQMYIDQPKVEDWTNDNPKDRNGLYIYGYENLYNSLPIHAFKHSGYKPNDIIEYKNSKVVTTSIAKQVPIHYGSMYGKFLDGTGGEYYYNCSDLGKNYEYYRLSNMYQMKAFFLSNYDKEGIVIISTSDEAKYTGVNVALDNSIITVIDNINAFSAVNSSKAVFVTEWNYFDGEVTFKTNYYVIDYYDWDPNNLYRADYILNSAGLAKNYLSVGYDSFTGRINDSDEIELD